MKHHNLLDNQIRLCQKGRHQGFNFLLEQFGPRLRAYFLRVSGSASDADDLLQDLFVKLIERIKDYKHSDRFENWLFTVAANIARDRIRKNSRGPRQMQTAETSNVLEYIVAEDALPDELASQAEQYDLLNIALQQLPMPDREMVILRHYGQLSFKELAQHFAVPLGTVLAKVHRSHKQLKKLLKEETKL